MKTCETNMSTKVEFEQLQKKITELENERASLEQKEQAIKESIRKLMEQVAAKLEDKIKARNAALEKLGSTQKDFEKKLEELQENVDPHSSSDEPISQVAKKEEESPKQVIEVAVGGSQQPQPEDHRKRQKEERKSTWW